MPSKLPYTQQIITKSGRVKTLYPIVCGYCKTKSFGFRSDNGKRFCSSSCASSFQYSNGRDKALSTARAREKLSTVVKTTTQAGSRHWNWRGGINEVNENARKTPRWKAFKSKILLRDNYTCQICDKYGGTLHVDHIKSWSDYPELRFDPNNCRTLCIPCHYSVTFKKVMPIGSKWGMKTRLID